MDAIKESRKYGSAVIQEISADVLIKAHSRIYGIHEMLEKDKTLKNIICKAYHEPNLRGDVYLVLHRIPGSTEEKDVVPSADDSETRAKNE